MVLSSPSQWFLGLLVSLCWGSTLASEAKMGYGYRMTSLEESTLNGGSLIGYLKVKQSTSKYGPDISDLRLFVKHENQDRLRVHITDADSPRWEVLYNLLPRAAPPPLTKNLKMSSHFSLPSYPGSNLVFTFEPDPFYFAVTRKSTGETIFNTSGFDFVFKDQYIQISTQLPETPSLYGLGENTQPGGIRLRPNDPYTLYPSDISTINLNTDLYGSHPVYMDLRNSGGRVSAHGILLLNSNGMDVFYKGTSLTYKIIGGLLDFYFFSGPNPLDVVDQYTTLIGRPAPMPYWALGTLVSLCYSFISFVPVNFISHSLVWFIIRTF